MPKEQQQEAPQKAKASEKMNEFMPKLEQGEAVKRMMIAISKMNEISNRARRVPAGLQGDALKKFLDKQTEQVKYLIEFAQKNGIAESYRGKLEAKNNMSLHSVVVELVSNIFSKNGLIPPNLEDGSGYDDAFQPLATSPSKRMRVLEALQATASAVEKIVK